MVLFWPFKAGDPSPASFEKSLSTISAKISRNQSQVDSLRQGLRRSKALSTLYGSIAYLIYAVIIVILLTRDQASPLHYGGLVGGPLGIYATRLLLDTAFNYRISQAARRLNSQHKERQMIIEKLKAATKYNSTQELLERYGGTPSIPQDRPHPQTPPSSSKGSNRKSGAGQDVPRRTNMPPPATANIRPMPATGPVNGQTPVSELRMRSGRQSLGVSAVTSNDRQDQQQPSEEFAPDAFSAPPQYSAPNSNPHWFDRVLDLLIGEDETSPRNRVVLICEKCRLVNGQAPPGVKRLEDIGRWKCIGCGMMNGRESETSRILALAQSETRSAEVRDASVETPSPAQERAEPESEGKDES